MGELCFSKPTDLRQFKTFALTKQGLHFTVADLKLASSEFIKVPQLI